MKKILSQTPMPRINSPSEDENIDVDLDAIRACPELLEHLSIQEMHQVFQRIGLREVNDALGRTSFPGEDLRIVSKPDNRVLLISIRKSAGRTEDYQIEDLGSFTDPGAETRRRMSMYNSPGARAFDRTRTAQTENARAWMDRIFKD